MTTAGDERSILLVDDDAPLRERLAFALRKRGFLVSTAANVEEALAGAWSTRLVEPTSICRSPLEAAEPIHKCAKLSQRR